MVITIRLVDESCHQRAFIIYLVYFMYIAYGQIVCEVVRINNTFQLVFIYPILDTIAFPALKLAGF